MSNLAAELKVNYAKFRTHLRNDFRAAEKAIDPDGKVFLDAYGRIASMNAWRANVFLPTIDPGVMGFILEAQNDAISSLAFATVGAWRTSLQGLRSAIENTLMGLYFADHLVEHTLWSAGRYKIGFTALCDYFNSHPAHQGLPSSIDPIPPMKTEYDTLSNAVHGRAPFRMTKDAASTVVCDSSIALRGAYLTRQRETLRCLTLLKLMLFSSHLQGTKQQELRTLLSQMLSNQSKGAIRTHYKVVLSSTK
jgi:hypothetical protein